MTTENNKQTQLLMKRVEALISELNSALPLLYTYDPGKMGLLELAELEKNINVLDNTAKKILYHCLNTIIRRYRENDVDIP